MGGGRTSKGMMGESKVICVSRNKKKIETKKKKVPSRQQPVFSVESSRIALNKRAGGKDAVETDKSSSQVQGNVTSP